MQEIGQERLGHVSDLARRRRHQACPLLAERRTFLILPFRKSYPDVLVVQSSQDRNGDNGARSLDCSMQGRIFL
jgi:hypothetical protein